MTHIAATRRYRFFAALTAPICAALVATQLAAPVNAARQSAPAAQLADAIEGRVFNDFNANGMFDAAASGAVDHGVAGVLVSAYAAGASTPLTATSSITGAYRLTGLSAGAPYRVEFSNLPAGYQPSFVDAAGSSVQFATAGAVNVDFAIQAPCDFCQADPYAATSFRINGDPLNGAGGLMSLLALPYGASGSNQHVTLTLGAQTGAIWGMAYRRAPRTLYASAVMQRHIGFGPLGIGGIYKMDLTATNAPTGALGTLADLTALGIDVGADPRVAGDLSSDPDVPNRDPGAFDAVGKRGLGALDIAPDGDALWTVNLHARELIRVNLSSGAPIGAGDVTTRALPAQTCANGEFRPFAVRAWRDAIYVGGVCSAELAGGGAADLRAIVLRYSASLGWSTALNFALDYPRSYVSTLIDAEWRPWIDAWSDLTPPQQLGAYMQTIWPQPMLTDIDFDATGAMVLGFADRLGLQGGSKNYSPVAGDTTVYDIAVAGDVLRACLVNGAYVLENDAACGGVQVDPSIDPSWPNSGSGPGGREYYSGENFAINTHNETGLGALLQFPGRGEIAMTAFNPLFSPRSQGLIWLNHATGKKNRGVLIADSDYPSATAGMGKASGLGDMALLCDPAPTQIGNRVWRDTNSNGVQDADEPGIAGVVVSLTLDSGLVFAATTDGSGNYLFSSAAASAVPSAARRAEVPLGPGTQFTVSINLAQSALSGLSPTGANNDGQTDNSALSDVRDSDGTTQGDVTLVLSQIEAVGHNNHSYDFGFVVVTPTSTPTSTNTPAPTATNTPTPTSTNTPVPTATPNPTNTPVASSTPNPTNTPVASSTPNPTNTTAPSSTPNPTITLAPSSTSMPLPTSTSTPTPPPVPLTLDKVGRGSAPNGAQSADRLITYTLTISNPTGIIAQNVVVSDVLPANLAYVAGSASVAPQSERPLLWRINVPQRGQVTIQFTTRDTATIAAPVRNLAVAISSGQIVAQDSTDVLTVQRPTAVLLDIMSATPGASGAVLFWRTTQEVSALGYHVLRASSDARHLAEQVTPHMIPARGPDGAEYAFVDANAVRGVAYHYWLQEVQLDGTQREYGPVVLSEPPLGSVINTQQGVIVPVPFGGIPAADVAFPAENLAQTKAGGSAIAIKSQDAEVLVRVTPTSAPEARPVSIAPAASDAPNGMLTEAPRANPAPTQPDAPVAADQPALPQSNAPQVVEVQQDVIAKIVPLELRRALAPAPQNAATELWPAVFGAGLVLFAFGLFGLALLLLVRRTVKFEG